MDNVFVTVGTQLPFPRLLNIINDLASHYPSVNFVAQTCQEVGTYKNLKEFKFLDAQKYSECLGSCSLLIGHAGMGTIISAHEFELPLIVMPRLLSLKEHRNDHQMATANKFSAKKGVHVVRDKLEMNNIFSQRESLCCCIDKENDSRKRLIEHIKNQIWCGLNEN